MSEPQPELQILPDDTAVAYRTGAVLQAKEPYGNAPFTLTSMDQTDVNHPVSA